MSVCVDMPLLQCLQFCVPRQPVKLPFETLFLVALSLVPFLSSSPLTAAAAPRRTISCPLLSSLLLSSLACQLQLSLSLSFTHIALSLLLLLCPPFHSSIPLCLSLSRPPDCFLSILVRMTSPSSRDDARVQQQRQRQQQREESENSSLREDRLHHSRTAAAAAKRASPSFRCDADAHSVILSFLDLSDFLAAAHVSREWRSVSQRAKSWPEPSMAQLADFDRIRPPIRLLLRGQLIPPFAHVPFRTLDGVFEDSLFSRGSRLPALLVQDTRSPPEQAIRLLQQATRLPHLTYFSINFLPDRGSLNAISLVSVRVLHFECGFGEFVENLPFIGRMVNLCALCIDVGSYLDKSDAVAHSFTVNFSLLTHTTLDRSETALFCCRCRCSRSQCKFRHPMLHSCKRVISG